MDRPLINTVAEATEFLRRIGVEVIGIWHGWILRGTEPNDDYELMLETNADLIEHARYERDACAKLSEHLGLESMERLFAPLSHSSEEETRSADHSERDGEHPSLRKAKREVRKWNR